MARPGNDSDSEDTDTRRSGGFRGRRLWTLWIVVGGLWTLATLLRVKQLWLPQVGWHHILVRPLLWISLLAPQAIFAIVIGAIHRMPTGRTRELARNVMS